MTPPRLTGSEVETLERGMQLVLRMVLEGHLTTAIVVRGAQRPVARAAERLQAVRRGA